jgi:hypothetical protein
VTLVGRARGCDRGIGDAAARCGLAPAAVRVGAGQRRDRLPDLGWTPTRHSPGRLRGWPPGSQRARQVDGRRTCLWEGRRFEPPKCGRGLLERAFEAAERGEPLDVRAVVLTAERNPGRRAHRGLRALLPTLAVPEPTRSELERPFDRVCRLAGLPLPQLNVLVGRLEVGALWRDLRLIVEVDSWQFHRTRASPPPLEGCEPWRRWGKARAAPRPAPPGASRPRAGPFRSVSGRRGRRAPPGRPSWLRPFRRSRR